jgi:membrane-bound metal-dependent hydrolase YbcI (DUF457 family)
MLQIIVFIICYLFLGLKSAIIITLFHFIPTIDYVMKKLNFYPELHRHLFHSIFAIIIASGLVFYLTNVQIGILSTLNLILHILMDLNGKGVAIFFPISKYRVKI